MGPCSNRFEGVILDLDGVLWIAGAPCEGAVTLLDRLRLAAMPFCLLTNDCSVAKCERYDALTGAGFSLQPFQLITAVEVADQWLRKANVQNIRYLGSPSALLDIGSGFSVRENGPVDAVVVGDMFGNYDRCSLDMAAHAINDGAALVALQNNRRWYDGRRWHIDNGFWVAGLEYVTGKRAVITGKPSPEAYLAAIARIGMNEVSRIAFVSDDVESDLKGAKTVGLTTVYFGVTQALPTWVDHRAEDMRSLSSLLMGYG
jgi:HAD superfamily hydrolase (TIGR01450 family)